jgi:citrate lyase subunit beta/citryl-CoA lyase
VLTDQLQAARTLLFVPGHRPDRFAKAAASGADCIILDLEDAVGPDHKDEARAHAATWLAAHDTSLVRINPPGTPAHEDDLAALHPWLEAVMLPKASSRSVAGVAGKLRAECRIVALVETATGVLEASAIAAHPSVVRLALGNVDLGAELGVDPDDRQALLWARSLLVLASAGAAKASPVDGVTTSISDPDRVRADTEHAASLGFSGKLCIHPRQIHPAHLALAPTDAQLAEAERIIEAAGDGDVTVLDGKMLDKPVIVRARSLIARANDSPGPRGAKP